MDALSLRGVSFFTLTLKMKTIYITLLTLFLLSSFVYGSSPDSFTISDAVDSLIRIFGGFILGSISAMDQGIILLLLIPFLGVILSILLISLILFIKVVGAIL